MEEREKILNEHYKNYDEDSRLIKDNTHKVEFYITQYYLNNIIKKGNKILELGAGTGRYSLFWANKGYDVTAIEYVDYNLDILKSHITPEMNIKAEQGDAIDLSRFEDNTFDVTLVLGPLYHLYDDDEINKAIKEAIRVTKTNGIIAITYITNDGVMANWGIDHLLDGYPNDFDETFKLKRYPGGIFATFYIDEFENIMSNYNIELIHEVATDSLSNVLSEKINNFTDEEFKVWLKYQISICERKDLQGFSCHMLYICRKL